VLSCYTDTDAAGASIRRLYTLQMSKVLLAVCVCVAHAATLSNIALPRDQNGEQIITGEAAALVHNGTYYFYFNNWGT
jgi:hypothetical protein